jgi:hypothetical protein
MVFFNLTSSNTDPTLDKLQAELAPKLPPTPTPSSWMTRCGPG